MVQGDPSKDLADDARKAKISVINASTFVPLVFIKGDDIAVSHVLRYIDRLPSNTGEGVHTAGRAERLCNN